MGSHNVVPTDGAASAIFDVDSQQVSWLPVWDYAVQQAAMFSVDLDKMVSTFCPDIVAGRLPVPGTPSWCCLPDGGEKLAAVLLLGAQYALLLDTQQEARADASRQVSAAVDWRAVAREVHDLNDFRATRPWSRRVSA